MKEEKFCENPACDPPGATKEGRKFCPRCTKRAQRLKDGGISLSAPPVEKLTPIQAALEAGTRWLETPAEADRAVYEANERAFLAAARRAGSAAARDAIRAGLRQAKARGVRVGRPRKLAGAAELAAGLVNEVGITKAARALRVARSTLSRLLRGAEDRDSRDTTERMDGAKGSLSRP